MNAIQRRYASAVARNDAHNAEANAIEQSIIAALNLTDSTGKPLSFLFCIQDDATFNLASEMYESALLKCGWFTRQPAILDELNAAIDALAEWGLSMFAEVYPKEAQTLRAEAKRSYSTRVKIADYAFRLHL